MKPLIPNYLLLQRRLNQFLFLLLFINSVQAQTTPDCNDMLRQAKRYEQNNELSKAVQFYLNALNCNTGLSSEIAPKLKKVFEKIEDQKQELQRQKQKAELQRDLADSLYKVADRSAKSNRMAAAALKHYNPDYSLAWHLAVAAWKASLDSINGGSLEPGVCAIMHDIVSDTNAWIGTPLIGHTDASLIQSVGFSPDGRFVLTSGSDSTARVWDVDGHLLVTLRGHTGAVLSAVFSPQCPSDSIGGKYILTSGLDSTIRIWDRSGQVLHVFGSRNEGYKKAQFSPDGSKVLAIAYVKPEAQLWSREGKLLAEYKGHSAGINSAVFSPDGSKILTASWDSTTRVWDTTGQLLKLERHSSQALSAYFYPDGIRILAACYDSNKSYKDPKSKEEIQLLQADRLSTVEFSPDKQCLLTTTDAHLVNLWTLDGRLIKNLRLQGSNYSTSVDAVKFTPDGRSILAFLVSNSGTRVLICDTTGNILGSWVDQMHSNYLEGSPDGRHILTSGIFSHPVIWRKNSQSIALIKGQKTKLQSAVYSGDGQYLITLGNLDNQPNLWDAKGNLVLPLKHHSLVGTAVFSPDNQYVLTAGSDRTARIWDIRQKRFRTLIGHSNGLTDAAFSPDGRFVVTAGWDSTICLWTNKGKLLKKLKENKGELYQVAYFPDGKHIFSLSLNQKACIWDTAGVLIKCVDVHTGPFIRAVFSPDGQNFLIYGRDSLAELWDKDGNLITHLEGHTQKITHICYSPDGKIIAGSSEDNTTILWASDGKWICNLTGHTDDVDFTRFSPSGKLILTVGQDYNILLWSRDGRLLKTLKGHQGAINDAVFSPDEQFIASAGADNTIRQWDIQGNMLITMKGHTANVVSVAFSSDGRNILSASEDETARIWESFPIYLSHHQFIPPYILLHEGAEIDKEAALKSSKWEELYFVGLEYAANGDWETAKCFFESSLAILYSPYTLEKIFEATEHLDKPFDFNRFFNDREIKDLDLYVRYFEKRVQKSGERVDKIKNYQYALRIREKQIEWVGGEKSKQGAAKIYFQLAILQLSAGDGKNAEANLRRAIDLDPLQTGYQRPLPHALLMQNRFKEAKALFLNLAPMKLEQEGYATFKDAFLADFHRFSKDGITLPHLEEIKTLLEK